MMIPSVLEKAGFGVVAVVLYLQHRLSPVLLGAGIIDLTFGLLFILAYVRTGKTESS